jgi:hypothetical protein
MVWTREHGPLALVLSSLPFETKQGLKTSARRWLTEELMPTEILLPKLGFSMTEGQIAEWLAENGAQVTE